MNMKKVVILLMIVFSFLSYCRGGEENDDMVIQGGLLLFLNQDTITPPVSTDCQNSSGFVICVPPGIGN